MRLPSVKSIALNCFVPLLLLAVAAHQIYHVENNHLTRWKGGGFGMYSTIPWEHRELWFMGWQLGGNPMKGFEKEADLTRSFPSNENIRALEEKVRDLHNTPGVYIEVWEPRLGKEGSLTRVFLKKADGQR